MRAFLLPLVCLWAGWLSLGVSPGQSQPPYHVGFDNAAELRQHFRRTPARKPLVSAHRGGPTSGFPENCLATFDHTLRFAPAIIECDVQLTKDGQLVMMHDETLDRTTNGTGKLADRTYDELQPLRLEDNAGQLTDYRIPTLSQVLDWARGKAILTVDVKRGVPAERIVEAIRQAKAESYAAVITYSAEAALQYHRLHPDLMISVTVRNPEDFQRLAATGIPFDHLLAFVGVSEPEPSLYELLHAKGISCILGTMGNLDRKAAARTTNVYADLIRNGADILATDQPKEAAEALKGTF
ncbi:MAG: glycerophosphodiester phosphodiesterase family protein [Ferruginibacter sp.]|nr:glycerophosphodiester phosphodiesterase family protein [Cytophagales bacterium]